ncbi:MAG: class I SAM-dependent methyltransferase [Longimicrobiaceae bacterium]
MNERDAAALIRAAVPMAPGATWADLGAGTGVFTRALAAILGPGCHVFAIDADERALASLRASVPGAGGAAAVTVRRADVTASLGLPPLDGVVMANVLHFIPDAAAELALAAAQLAPGGRLVLVEYEGRRPSRWVPYPVAFADFQRLAPAAGLSPPRLVATRPSAFGGELYVAAAERVR